MPGHYLELSLKGINGVRINGVRVLDSSGIKYSDPIDSPIDSISFKIHQYWNVEDYYKQEKFDCGEEQILEKLEELLTDSVNLRMVSDVPVGVFLSGGYDSTLVTALLAQDKTRKLHTYTIGFDDEKFNEAEHAKSISNHFGTTHTEYYVTEQDMLDKVSLLAFHYDEPFGDSSAIPTMLVAELAKKEVTVALSADGGDEAFCGYSKYFVLDKFRGVFQSKFKKKTIKTILKLVNETQAELLNSWLPKNKQATNIKEKFIKFKRAIESESLHQMFINASSYVDAKEVAGFLNIDSTDSISEKIKFSDELTFIENMMLSDYKTFMLDDVLTKVDRACMSVSLEGREPLIDHRIIEFMARVPEQIKYKHKQGKYLARKILYKHIPKTLVDKPKAGFQIPLARWLQSDLKPLVDKYLAIEMLDIEIFNKDAVQDLKTNLYNGDDLKANSVWFILMFQMWREQWNV
jgi:asparagine synthase (glutamine-hydrolysing)